MHDSNFVCVKVACPYCISCFQRCYPGSKIDSKELLENLQQYVFATSFPMPHSNGIIPLSLAPIVNDDNQESNSGVSFENGGVEPNENGAEILVNESVAKDISNQADSDDGTAYPSCDLKLTSINILNDIFYAFLMNI